MSTRLLDYLRKFDPQSWEELNNIVQAMPFEVVKEDLYELRKKQTPSSYDVLRHDDVCYARDGYGALNRIVPSA